MLGIPTSLTDARGFRAEKAVFAALKYLKRKKILVKNFSQTIKYSPEDLSGIDFRLELFNGDTMFLNAKNYWDFKEVMEYRQRGIWVAAVWLEDLEKKPKSESKLKKEAIERTKIAINDFLRVREIEKQRVEAERLAGMKPLSFPDRIIALFKKSRQWFKKLSVGSLK